MRDATTVVRRSHHEVSGPRVFAVATVALAPPANLAAADATDDFPPIPHRMIITTCDTEQYMAAARDTSPIYFERYMIDRSNRPPADVQQQAFDRIHWFFSLDAVARRQYSEDTATNVYYENVATHWGGNWAKLFFNNKGVVAHATDVCMNYPQGRHVRVGLGGYALTWRSNTRSAHPRSSNSAIVHRECTKPVAVAFRLPRRSWHRTQAQAGRRHAGPVHHSAVTHEARSEKRWNATHSAIAYFIFMGLQRQRIAVASVIDSRKRPTVALAPFSRARRSRTPDATAKGWQAVAHGRESDVNPVLWQPDYAVDVTADCLVGDDHAVDAVPQADCG